MSDHCVLLPGLDGTGRLFDPFLTAKPERFTAQVISYPPKEIAYENLESYLKPKLPESRDFWLVAESFSGPLAVRIGAQGPPGLLGVVLVCSFVRSPRPFWLRALPWSLLCRVPSPAWVLRWTGAGFQASPELVRQVRAARESIGPAVVAGRLASVSTVDESESLVRCAIPTLYLRARRDRIVLRGSAEHIRRLKPDTEVAVLDGPHMLLQAAPASAWAAVGEFIDRHRAAG